MLRIAPLILAAALFHVGCPEAAALQGLQSPALDNILGTVVGTENPTRAQRKAIAKVNRITDKAFRGNGRPLHKCIKDVRKLFLAVKDEFGEALGGADIAFEDVMIGIASGVGSDLEEIEAVKDPSAAVSILAQKARKGFDAFSETSPSAPIDKSLDKLSDVARDIARAQALLK